MLYCNCLRMFGCFAACTISLNSVDVSCVCFFSIRIFAVPTLFFSLDECFSNLDLLLLLLYIENCRMLFSAQIRMPFRSSSTASPIHRLYIMCSQMAATAYATYNNNNNNIQIIKISKAISLLHYV